MIVRTGNHPGILLLAAFFIFAAPAAARADSLFRLFPEAQLSGFYDDNFRFRTTNEEGDFGSVLAAGFFLDYTSAARYALLHYDTFAQLFAHNSQYDRAGEGQYVNATDDENLSATTKLRLNELFFRDAPGYMSVVGGNQGPAINTVAAELLLANDRASVNICGAELMHYWGRNWSSALDVRQATLWSTGSNSNPNYTSYGQSIGGTTEYHFSERFSLGATYRYYYALSNIPGRPGEQSHGIYVRPVWQPMENLSLSGHVGIMISHLQGTNQENVALGGSGQLTYSFRRARLTIYGGQEPTALVSSTGKTRFVNGSISYTFTQRLTGTVGAGYYEFSGTQFSGQIISWGVGLSDRVNKWLVVYARFLEIDRTETASSQFLPSGMQNGQGATGNYFTVGLNVSVEAFRWSWQ